MPFGGDLRCVVIVLDFRRDEGSATRWRETGGEEGIYGSKVDPSVPPEGLVLVLVELVAVAGQRMNRAVSEETR